MIYRGKESLSDAELLSILIQTGSGEKSAADLAEEILALDDDGMAFIRDCMPEELIRIRGIGAAKACQIMAAVELGRRTASHPGKARQRIGSSQDVADIFLEKMRYHKKEFFDVVLLNAKGGIMAVENVAVGDLCSSIVHPREAFSSAVRRSAAGVIFMHNHPSGDPQPSRDDIDVTQRLCETGRILGISVLDHIIIGDGTYISFKEKGLI